MRQPSEIIHNGEILSDIIDRHERYLRGKDGGGYADLSGADLSDAYLSYADLSDAYLRDAYLSGADLSGAYLRDAYLSGAVGNMREIKSAQFDQWPITYTQAPDGTVLLWIGCQGHPLTEWEDGSPEWIDEMDSRATAWWGRNRDFVLDFVKRFPAVPHGTRA